MAETIIKLDMPEDGWATELHRSYNPEMVISLHGSGEIWLTRYDEHGNQTVHQMILKLNIVSREPKDAPHLTWQELTVLKVLINYSKEFRDTKTIAKDAKLEPEDTEKALKSLLEKGYIFRGTSRKGTLWKI